MNKYMQLAKECAEHGSNNNDGGPFGAVIVDSEGKIIAKANNMVLKNNDPTAHAEVSAIREACKNLETYDLSGCSIYTSCEPCPMCLSAIIWANIKNVYYACTRNDANEIGFRDNAIYEFLEGKNRDLLNIQEIDREECLEVFENYRKNNKTIY